MASKITHFEACIGQQWLAWDASDDVKISSTGRMVTIEKNVERDGKIFVLKTLIDLDQVPAYAKY